MEKFDKLVPLIKQATALNYKDLQGGSQIGEFKIDLIEDKIMYIHPYRRSEVETQVMANIADELLEAGIISLSTSPHCSPFFVIKKKDGSYRPIIDYRQLNKNTKRIDWPLPRIDDLLNKPKRAIIFTGMDAKAGFFQIPVETTSKKYTAFSDGLRKFEWNFMPMGVMNAPMTFSMIMNQVLGDLSFVLVYMDDIVIFSNSIDDHIKHIKIVMKRLNDVNIKINLENVHGAPKDLKY